MRLTTRRKQKEGEKVACALEHQPGAREQRGGKAQAQHDLRAVDGEAAGELAADGGALRRVDALVDVLEVALLLIGGAHLAYALERLWMNSEVRSPAMRVLCMSGWRRERTPKSMSSATGPDHMDATARRQSKASRHAKAMAMVA